MLECAAFWGARSLDGLQHGGVGSRRFLEKRSTRGLYGVFIDEVILQLRRANAPHARRSPTATIQTQATKALPKTTK